MAYDGEQQTTCHAGGISGEGNKSWSGARVGLSRTLLGSWGGSPRDLSARAKEAELHAGLCVKSGRRGRSWGNPSVRKRGE